MKNLKTRIFSGLMAGILAVSLAVPAFASSNTSTNITATYVDIVIDVNVPTTGTAQVNPYGLPVKLDDAGTNKITGEQIVTKPLFLVNNSDSNLNVSASVTATATGDLRFAAAAPTASDTYKTSFVYLQMKPTTLTYDNDRAQGTDTGIQGIETAKANAVFAGWKQDYAAATDLVLNGTSAATKDKMVTLLAATIDTSGTDPVSKWNAGSIAAFRLAGKVNANPKDPWVVRDGFTAAIAFTFKPDTAAASLDKTELELATTTGTADLTVSLSDGVGIKSVVWESDATGKATVAAKADPANGSVATVTGVATGNANITAKVVGDNGITYTATCAVTIP